MPYFKAFASFLLSSTLFWFLFPLASSLPFLLEDKPDAGDVVEKIATNIFYLSEDEPSLYNVVVTTNKEEKNTSKEDSKDEKTKVMGDQICPGDLDQCLDACLPVLAILELAHTYCVAECKERCAP